ncbi:MAG: SDR family NAD(P)-dependent oxidoreductase [Reyranella sp.]|uniref:SDR family NAD(P)-dependent oxidoreductase n=1 Tax=Reyranella sp. TaxID=1929291 RepID=UPI00272FB156|nr:SDR family NAD(P)-dependent oxidoreductase [Reyranella sp.]MDP1967454.1 SDR family NAD(P)-dependent oxidoreductase [Reyranella sp.]MDP2376432.1 SDR family NAD(P)-dependent oxidoreductase [Reyranella sp.]
MSPAAPLNAIAITGASSGIGAALSRQLAQPGRVLALIGRDRARLEQVAADCRSKGATCRIGCLDVRDADRLSAFLDEFDREQPIDTFISNAGILDGRRADQEVEDGETARLVLETNLLAAIDAVHMVLPKMRQRRRGEIVLVASLAALVPLPDAPAYAASKAGLMSYGVALRDAVAGEGIKVVVACPGYVSTAMAEIHLGPRPGEISADAAAAIILRGLHRNKDLVGFPLVPFWLSRLNLLVPEFIRRRGLRGTRFHVGQKPRQAPRRDES